MTMGATPRIVKAGEFKAKCLELMDRVADSGESIVITKRGRPVAMLTAIRDPSKAAAGFFKGKMQIVGDIVSPLDIDWGPREPDIRPPYSRRKR
jgi:prevent-host-death family protein